MSSAKESSSDREVDHRLLPKNSTPSHPVFNERARAPGGDGGDHQSDEVLKKAYSFGLLLLYRCTTLLNSGPKHDEEDEGFFSTCTRAECMCDCSKLLLMELPHFSSDLYDETYEGTCRKERLRHLRMWKLEWNKKVTSVLSSPSSGVGERRRYITIRDSFCVPLPLLLCHLPKASLDKNNDTLTMQSSGCATHLAATPRLEEPKPACNCREEAG
ncbi:hypothetical protein RUM43_011816 [Polyplax serrata]|uniref:Uncharacterized protein n=1 Tax=Polyplax serrata TaxID=468196 RepID=A0AAN8PIQ1_POLSC